MPFLPRLYMPVSLQTECAQEPCCKSVLLAPNPFSFLVSMPYVFLKRVGGQYPREIQVCNRAHNTHTHLFDHSDVVPRVELVCVPASQLLQDHASSFLGFFDSLQSGRGGQGRLLPLVYTLLLMLFIPLLATNRTCFVYSCCS